MELGVTGHRPDKLGGWKPPNPVYNYVMDQLDEWLVRLHPDLVYTGMALGVDTWMAQACIATNIPFVAVVPFHGFHSKWPPHSQIEFANLLTKAHSVIYTTAGEVPYSPMLMQIRNQWIVDHADEMLAVFDGSPGGTANTVRIARASGKPLHLVEFNDHIKSIASGVYAGIQLRRIGRSAASGPLSRRFEHGLRPDAIPATRSEVPVRSPPIPRRQRLASTPAAKDWDEDDFSEEAQFGRFVDV